MTDRIACLLSLVMLTGLVLAILAPAHADPVVRCVGDCVVVDQGELAPAVQLAAFEVPAPAIGTSPSATLPDPEEDPAGFFAALYAAGKSKSYRMLSALALIGVVWALRRFGARWFAALGTDRGGALSALLLGVAGAFATALAAGAPVGVSFVLDGLTMGFTAAGGYAVIRRLLWPKDAA